MIFARILDARLSAHGTRHRAIVVERRARDPNSRALQLRSQVGQACGALLAALSVSIVEANNQDIVVADRLTVPLMIECAALVILECKRRQLGTRASAKLACGLHRSPQARAGARGPPDSRTVPVQRARAPPPMQ